MSLTENIYSELIAGLEKGLDWQQFLAKYGNSKGPLYNAHSKLFSEIPAKITALNEERKRTQQDLDEVGLRLNRLNQKINEADKTIQAKNRDILVLEEKENTLKKQIEVLKGDLGQKSKLSEQLQELEKSGFGEERLKTLRITLIEMGAKRGLKRNEAVNAFFAELGDYDAIQGFTQELQRLDAIISIKSSQAEKWGTEAESLERRREELKGAIAAIQSLSKEGVKPERIISWNNSLTSIGGVEQLEKGLNRYKSVQEFLATKKREAEHLDMNVAKLNGEVNTLEEQKAGLEGSIRALRGSAVKEVERISQVSTEKINRIAQEGSNSVRQVGETVLGELKEALSLVDGLSARALEVGKMIGQIESKLDKSKETREKTEALVSAVEARR